jgi:hypothetical protein
LGERLSPKSLSEPLHVNPAQRVGDGGRDDVEVVIAHGVDHGRLAPVQEVAADVENLKRRKISRSINESVI